ncbi:hypothetical protein GCM10008957_27480 [Deinococcus ruber]|uniref:Uncharacterized protein n=1 Tax=Deinococcus ruber TaxID=1848197 RepID=A0A918C973_9DEIO|nr:hypothetical protein GCM10008957_27480 [Deinococcus ruber]
MLLVAFDLLEILREVEELWRREWLTQGNLQSVGECGELLDGLRIRVKTFQKGRRQELQQRGGMVTSQEKEPGDRQVELVRQGVTGTQIGEGCCWKKDGIVESARWTVGQDGAVGAHDFRSDTLADAEVGGEVVSGVGHMG